MRQKILILMCVLTLVSTVSEANTSEDIELERIVVTPSRIEEVYGESGRKVDIISSQEVKDLNPKDIIDVLEDTTSINISDYGSLGAKKIISMRGSTEKQVLVLVDGRAVNNPRSGDIELSTIPLNNIERIEVMHGPASSVYGSQAMGGVVNIITKQPPSKGQKTELMTSFGTFRTYQERLSYGAKWNGLAYILNTSYQSSGGHRDNAEFNAKDVNSKLIYEFNPGNKLTLNGGFYKDKLGTPDSILSPDLNDKQLDRKNFFDLIWDTKPWTDKDIEISSRIYQNYDRLEFIETPEPLDKTTHTTKARAINLKFNQRISKLYRLIYGFDWMQNLNDSSKSAKHEYIVRAGYVENQLDLWEKLKVDLGIRFDDYSNFGTEVSPSANILYRLNENTRFHFLIAHSFRTPTFNDLYWPSTGSEEGNPNLQPEKGISGEFGIEKRFSKLFKIGLTYFRNGYNNLINWQKDSDNIWRPKNIDSAIINGVEQEYQIKLFDNLNIDVAYIYLGAKDDKIDKYITYQPKHKARLSINYKEITGLKISLKGQFIDKAFDNPTNTIYVKRFFVLTFDISKNIGQHATYFISIDNLLNKKYQIRRNYPMPGFSITNGIRFEF